MRSQIGIVLFGAFGLRAIRKPKQNATSRLLSVHNQSYADEVDLDLEIPLKTPFGIYK